MVLRKWIAGFGWALGAALALVPVPAASQEQPKPAATPEPLHDYREVMVPVRDGAKLQTVILIPKKRTGPLPILLQRSPYGVPKTAPPNLIIGGSDPYIFVFQNMRGRFKSDGTFTMSTAIAPEDAKAIDEVTDAWDTIDWLVKNVPGNNGRVGMFGGSYPGFAAAVAAAKPHPALKAISAHAAWDDWWINDDLHRYGALRLSYATDWLHSLQMDKNANKRFVYDTHDVYDWFLKLGPVGNLDTLHFKGSVPMYTALVENPDYTAHWTRQRWTDAIKGATVPLLNVVGMWDQEDPLGSWRIYRAFERNDPQGINHIVSGPWNHGSQFTDADKLSEIPLGAPSGAQFRQQIEEPFFRYWLHEKGEKPNFEARVFQSGSNSWKSYPAWPPREATPTELYLLADGTLSFTAPAKKGAKYREYVSDPAKPVPYRPRPISPTNVRGKGWQWWEAADQRFADGRPDVLTYVSAPLDKDLVVTGEIAATLFASTSGTDSDFVVKLIDVFPDDYTDPKDTAYEASLRGYQLPVAMEIRRGRYLKSFEKPAPLAAGRPTAWDVPLRSHDHVFLKGHRIMVQIQSSWFPVIDRNPQRFVPNIYKAKESDFVKATQRVYSTPALPSRITLPVMP